MPDDDVLIACRRCATHLTDPRDRRHHIHVPECPPPDTTEPEPPPAWLEVKRAGGRELPGLETTDAD